MRAALMHAPGELEVEEVPRPHCPERGLVIKVEACSICASDVKMVRRGHRDLRYPRILGHEVVGSVVESASKRRIRLGDRVQVWPGSSCGHCPECRRGNDNQCSEVGILGFNLDGGFAEYMAVPEGCVSRGVNLVPDHLESDLASLTEPLACCINAQAALRVHDGDGVVVVGGGPLGALHAMLARQRGASFVMVIEKDGERRQRLCQTEADVVVDPSRDPWDATLREGTEGRGADVLIMATPEAAIDAKLISALSPRGRLSLFSGLPKERALAPIDLNQLHYSERSLIGSYGCRSQDCREALGLLARGTVQAGWLITMRLCLDAILKGLAHAEAREGMKATIIGK